MATITITIKPHFNKNLSHNKYTFKFNHLNTNKQSKTSMSIQRFIQLNNLE